MKGSARISARLIAVMAIFVFTVCLSPFAVRYANAESEVKVTLHANGGSYSLSEYGVVDSSTSIVTFNIDDDGQASYVNTGVRPKWEGKRHVGWSTDLNANWPTWYEWFQQPNEDGMYEFALPLDGSIKDLYAVWADEYPVTLNANGGSFGEWYDKYGSHKLETFDVVFWDTEKGKSYSSTTMLPDIILDEDMGDLEHVGWSADKNAKRPEYDKGFDRLELNASTPKILYAVFGDPKEGNALITPKQTVYNVDITKTTKCRIEYTTKWDGVASPSVSSVGWDWVDSPIGSDGKYEYNNILFCTGGDGTDFADTSDAYIADGWLEFDVLNKGTAELVVLADINGKRYSSQTITVNVTDPSSGSGDDNSGQTPDDQQGGDEQKPDDQQGSDEQKPDNQQGSDEQKPAADPAKEKGEDGTPYGKGASAEAVEAAITNLPNDNDPAGAAFAPLMLKSIQKKNTSITLKWKVVNGATRYVIYGSKCGKSNKLKRLGKSTGSTKTIKKISGKKLKKGTYYKFMVVAVDSSGHVVSTSKIVHAATKGGKNGNPTKVTVSKKVKKNKLTIKKGKTFKLAGKAQGKNVKEHVGVRYESSNKKIATVTKSGKIKAKKKGTCKIYVFAQNGLCKAINVTVK